LSLEFGLFFVERVSLNDGCVHKLFPDIGQFVLLVHFVGVEAFDLLLVNQGVHVCDGLELEIKIGLFLPDFFEGRHDRAERIDVLYVFFNLELDLLDLVAQFAELGLSDSAHFLREDAFPVFDVAAERVFDAISLK